eukprot:1137720-Pelagomonas_calceolata.AAC.4
MPDLLPAPLRKAGSASLRSISNSSMFSSSTPARTPKPKGMQRTEQGSRQAWVQKQNKAEQCTSADRRGCTNGTRQIVEHTDKCKDCECWNGTGQKAQSSADRHKCTKRSRQSAQTSADRLGAQTAPGRAHKQVQACMSVQTAPGRAHKQVQAGKSAQTETGRGHKQVQAGEGAQTAPGRSHQKVQVGVIANPAKVQAYAGRLGQQVKPQRS